MYLVIMAGSLAVLCQALNSLVNESNIVLVYVEAQQAKASCSAATNTVQKLQCLTHKVIVVLIVLAAQEILYRQNTEFIYNVLKNK